eukprot:CAMPEP_0182864730 /NCGR_PEP_ID=MMETSP0034_2-20130328/7318_1 /TAXON_ID=156128 /ORGANISM="Nephroselmis pyriformis, Strain CCMP717" /LENGTH=96 /DNA_ID=CAMNT_0024996993 /DNA_START=343 /DNA_END=634 /DNA_ORIENTATION=+
MDAQAHQRVQVRGFSWSPTMHDAVTPEHFMSLGAQGIPADWPGAVPVQYVGGYGGGWPMPSGYAYAMDGPPPSPTVPRSAADVREEAQDERYTVNL